VNILITGSSGLVGSELSSYLSKNKHRVLHMVRKTPISTDEIYWDPSTGKLDPGTLEGLDAVVHLAGESIASGRWTTEKKRRIRESRIMGTRLLSQSLERLSTPPKVFVSTSATGYYGDRGEEELDEESSTGTGFLPSVCCEWENSTAPAVRKEIRVVILRIGMVLSASGGALPLMLPIFRLCIGGKIGNGRQYMSWIAIDDIVGIIEHSIQCESLRGPVNAVSPNAVTNLTFSKTLGQVLSRPALFALPSFAARIIFGEMAKELLLASARVSPSRLRDTNYQFRFPILAGALRHVLQKPCAG
jgi:uncharacterized protein (TIGR01777 family)